MFKLISEAWFWFAIALSVALTRMYFVEDRVAQIERENSSLRGLWVTTSDRVTTIESKLDTEQEKLSAAYDMFRATSGELTTLRYIIMKRGARPCR